MSLFGNISGNRDKERDGYRESINRGISYIRSYNLSASRAAGTREEQLSKLSEAIANAEHIVIGAGAGLSTSAGLEYGGERFERYFHDFAERFGIQDMYSGGFYPFPDDETRWAWWARHIYYNRYVDPPKPVYEQLLELVKNKDYFVITTNVDHQFQRAGFDKERLFYTQGDYGLFQSVDFRNQKTYDNEEWVMKAMEAQGFVKEEKGVFQVPENGEVSMRIPTELIPKCPDDGKGVTMNLRADDSFVEDEGWHRASRAYAEFLDKCSKARTLYLELGIGSNTPIIVKYPFLAFTSANNDAFYACLNYGEAFTVRPIMNRSAAINGDIGEILREL